MKFDSETIMAELEKVYDDICDDKKPLERSNAKVKVLNTVLTAQKLNVANEMRMGREEPLELPFFKSGQKQKLIG